jgi:hypothetical protein
MRERGMPVRRMSRGERLTVVWMSILIGVLSAAVLLGPTSGAAAKKRKKSAPRVTCQRFLTIVEQTARELEAQYNSIGFSIESPADVIDGRTVDGYLVKNSCRRVGKRSRQGGGLLSDILSEGQPPFPGETNPEIKEYGWSWTELVTKTRKGKILDAVSDLRCQKYTYSGSAYDPHDIQTFAC